MPANRRTSTNALNRAQRIRLAGEALVDERSVASVYNARPVRSTTYERVRRAAKALGLPLPPQRPSPP